MSIPHSSQYWRVASSALAGAMSSEERRDIEADSARTHDGDAAPGFTASAQEIGVTDDLRVIDAGNGRHTRPHAGSHYNLVEARRQSEPRRKREHPVER